MSENDEINPDVESALDSNPSVYTENEPVLVYEASTTEEFEVVRATMEAAGIPAFLKSQTVNPFFGAIDEFVDTLWHNGIYVSPANVEAAQTLLNAPPPSDEELIAQEEADPTTLEEAEERVKKA